jgi:hypothetical protein
VDVTAWHTGGAHVPRDGVGETGRTADKDVALLDVGDELVQMVG